MIYADKNRGHYHTKTFCWFFFSSNSKTQIITIVVRDKK